MCPVLHNKKRQRRAFTLVEILIVVVIIGILAAIVVPRYVDAGDETQEAAVRGSLRTLRAQIIYFQGREGAWPTDLNEMVTDGYLQELPTHPGPGNWNYDNTTGAITSSVDGSW